MLVAGGLLGLYFVVAALLQAPVVASAMGSPEACAICHSMEDHAYTFQKSAHRTLTCDKCHVAQGFLAKPLDEAKSASRHLWTTMLGDEPDVFHLAEDSRKVVTRNCASCHWEITRDLHPERREACLDCHRTTPHARTVRVGQ